MPPKPAIAWFPKKGFAVLRAAQADAGQIPARWEDWRQNLEHQLQQLGRVLEDCTRVDLELIPLRHFCDVKGIPMDSRGRSLFAATVAAVVAQQRRSSEH